MMKFLNLKLISADKLIFEGNVTHVKFPGTKGEFSIHPNHAPLISSLKAGHIFYGLESGVIMDITINGGFVEVLSNVVTVCVE